VAIRQSKVTKKTGTVLLKLAQPINVFTKKLSKQKNFQLFFFKVLKFQGTASPSKEQNCFLLNFYQNELLNKNSFFGSGKPNEMFLLFQNSAAFLFD